MENKQKVVASLLVWHRGSVLLLHRARHFKGLKTGRGEWELPGGSLDFGENPADAALREMKEETGIAVKENPKFTKVLSYTVGEKDKAQHRIVLVYSIKLKDTEPIPFLKLSDEHDAFRWITHLDDLEMMKMPPKLSKLLERLL